MFSFLYKNSLFRQKLSGVSLNSTHTGGSRWPSASLCVYIHVSFYHSEIAENLVFLVPVHLRSSFFSALGVGFLLRLRCRGAQAQTHFFKRLENVTAAVPRHLHKHTHKHTRMSSCERTSGRIKGVSWVNAHLCVHVLTAGVRVCRPWGRPVHVRAWWAVRNGLIEICLGKTDQSSVQSSLTSKGFVMRGEFKNRPDEQE